VKAERDSERLFRYVERYFAKMEKTAFPTVRRVARSLGWSHERIQNAIDDDWDGRLFTTSFFTTWEQPFGEHFVESFGPHEGSDSLPVIDKDGMVSAGGPQVALELK
jgi:hypothetical protein